jgi:hypothetical protein
MLYKITNQRYHLKEIKLKKSYLMVGPIKYPMMSPYFGIKLTEDRRTLAPVSPLKNGTVPTTGSLGSPGGKRKLL